MGIYEVEPRAYYVSLYGIMNVVDEPDLFVRALFDFMTIPIIRNGSVGEAGCWVLSIHIVRLATNVFGTIINSPFVTAA